MKEENKMIGAILAGGYGKRLKPLTDEIPKCLIEIKENYTILDKQLLQFKHAGINEVYLLVGHLHNKIKERYGAKWSGVNIKYLVEKEPRGTLYAINNLLSEADNETVAVRNGDVVADVNLKRMAIEHRKGELTMFVFPLVSPYGIVDIFGKKIVAFREKPKLNYYINGGIYIISPELFPFFRKQKGGNVEKLVFSELAKENLINAYYEDGIFWHSADSIKDLEEIRREFSNRTDKPWGYEKIIALTDKYLTKELYIMKGEGTSYHYHLDKDETMHVVRGEVLIMSENGEKILKSNETLRIKPKEKHKIFAAENTLLNEYSTPHPEDTVRIKDIYER